jgi:hypothetical protein
MAGKDHVVAGSARNNAQALATKVLPEKVSAGMHGMMSEPGSGDD